MTDRLPQTANSEPRDRFFVKMLRMIWSRLVGWAKPTGRACAPDGVPTILHDRHSGATPLGRREAPPEASNPESRADDRLLDSGCARRARPGMTRPCVGGHGARAP